MADEFAAGWHAQRPQSDTPPASNDRVQHVALGPAKQRQTRRLHRPGDQHLGGTFTDQVHENGRVLHDGRHERTTNGVLHILQFHRVDWDSTHVRQKDLAFAIHIVLESAGATAQERFPLRSPSARPPNLL